MDRMSLIAGLSFGIVALLCVSGQAKVEDKELTVDVCIMCHKAPPRDIDAKGGKHKTEVTCLDCHEGHPPAVRDNIPQCGKCHEGKEHYELEGCLGCHANPHTPLEITLAAGLTEPCLTCHKKQIETLINFPTKHSAMACTYCHKEKHKVIPKCHDCHGVPHPLSMISKFPECTMCHGSPHHLTK